MTQYEELYPYMRMETDEDERRELSEEEFDRAYEAYRASIPKPGLSGLDAVVGKVLSTDIEGALGDIGFKQEKFAKGAIDFIKTLPEIFEKSAHDVATEEGREAMRKQWVKKISPLGELQIDLSKFDPKILAELLPEVSPAGRIVPSPRSKELAENVKKGVVEFLKDTLPAMAEGLARLTPEGAGFTIREHFLTLAEVKGVTKQLEEAGLELPDELKKLPIIPPDLRKGPDTVMGMILFPLVTIKGVLEGGFEYMIDHPVEVAFVASMLTPKGMKIAKEAKWRFDNRTYYKLIDSIPPEYMSLNAKRDLIRSVMERGDNLADISKTLFEGIERDARRKLQAKAESETMRVARHIEPDVVPEGVFEAPFIGEPLPESGLGKLREKATKPETMMQEAERLKGEGPEFEPEFIGEKPPPQPVFEDMKRISQKDREMFEGLLDESMARDPDVQAGRLDAEQMIYRRIAKAKLIREQMNQLGGEMKKLAEILEKEEAAGVDLSEIPAKKPSEPARATKEAKPAEEGAKARLEREIALEAEKELNISRIIELEDTIIPRLEQEKFPRANIESAKRELAERLDKHFDYALTAPVNKIAPAEMPMSDLMKQYNVVSGGTVVRATPKAVGSNMYRGDVLYTVANSGRELLPAKTRGTYITGEYVYRMENVKTGEKTGWMRNQEVDALFTKEPVEGFYPKQDKPMTFADWAEKYKIHEKHGDQIQHISTLVERWKREIEPVPKEVQFKEGIAPSEGGKVVEKAGPFTIGTQKYAEITVEKARERVLERKSKFYRHKRGQYTANEMKDLLKEIEQYDENLVVKNTETNNLYSGYPFVEEFKKSLNRLIKGEIAGTVPLTTDQSYAIAVNQHPDIAAALAKDPVEVYTIPTLIEGGRIRIAKGSQIYEVPLGVEQKAVANKIKMRLEGFRRRNEPFEKHLEYLNSILKNKDIIIPADAVAYELYRDISSLRQGLGQPHYWISEIDGIPSYEALVKMIDQGSPMMKYVLYRAHDFILQSLKYDNVRSAQIANIADTYKIKVGTPEDVLAGNILGEIGMNYHKIPLDQLAKKEKIANLLKKAKSPQRGMELLAAAVEARHWYNDAIKAQNLARELRGQPAIPFRQFYTPDTIRAFSIYERAATMMQAFEDFFNNVEGAQGKAIPDFAVPNKPYNPRELAKQYGIEDMYKLEGMVNQMRNYLPFEIKDIYYTSIIKNNKAFAKLLKDKGKSHSAKAVLDWTAEAFGGLRSAIDRNLAINTTKARWMAWFRGALHRSVFPGYVAWSAFVQTSSANLTFARYGLKAGIKGLQWFVDKAHQDMLFDNTYSLQTKTIKAGDIVRQEMNEGIYRSNALERKGALAKVEDWMTFMVREMEKHLTGWSNSTAYHYFKDKGHPVNTRSFWERVSEGGGKTQSFYHLEDRPGYLRSQFFRTFAPFQTFNLEVFNTVGEMLGRTGIKDAKVMTRVGKALRFLGGAMAINFITSQTIGRKPWGLDSAVPFYNFTIGPIAQAAQGKPVSPRHLPSPVGIGTELAQSIYTYATTGDWDNLRGWMIKYGSSYMHIPGGTSINNLTEGLIAIADGGVEDSTGRMHFPIDDPIDKFKAVAVGPYRTHAGQEWLKSRKKDRDEDDVVSPFAPSKGQQKSPFAPAKKKESPFAH